ncbi:helicase HerA-like domain-containing protein, partial [Peptoniphilus asaccharolyticus]
MEKILIGRGDKDCVMLSNKLNQHGLIAGATGTGKTVTLKVMAENFSKLGIPVILSDVKGDLTNISKVGDTNDKITKRLSDLKIDDFEFSKFPTRLWDVYGEKGLQLKVSISEMGPVLLSRIMDLNETQAGVLNIAFRVADENGLLLLDLKDLKAILKLLQDYYKEFSERFGNIAPQTISALQRRLFVLEDNGADIFFGEPSISISDLLQTDSNGCGIVNIINSEKLINNPTVYSMFLLYLLSELFENLPEVGNPEKPKLVFFFDEAHLLFDNLPKIIEDKIEQVVRLIRSKGVGIFFVTQNPLDIPDKISSQLGNRVLHQLRAFSPSELKVVDSVSKTFRQNENLVLKDEITNLKTGEALISFLNEDGSPEIVEKAMVLPPHSSFTPLTSMEILNLVDND